MDIDSTLNWAWIFPCAEELVCCLDYHPVMLWSNDHNLIDQAKKKIEARADLLGYYKNTFSFCSDTAGQRDLSDLEIIFDSTRRLKELNFPNCCGLNRDFGLKDLK